MAHQQIETAEFLSAAQALEVGINKQSILAAPRQFSTGSVGYYATGKMIVTVAGKPLQVQVGVTLTVIGSKPGKE